MALYQGEDMVDVTAPNGSTYKLPRSLVPASLMPQQIGQTPGPAPQGFSDEQAAPVAAEVPSATGGALPPTQQPEPFPEPQVVNGPDKVIKTVDNTRALAATDKALQQEKAAQAKQQKAQAAYNASPQGVVAGALGQQTKAISDEEKAVTNQSDLEAAGQSLVANAFAKRNSELDDLFAKRKAEAEADLAAQDKKRAELEAMRKKIANTKINRESAHPLLAAIGVALADLGAARDGKPMQGLETLYKVIDRSVAGQMADLDQQKDVLGIGKDELAALKEKASSRLSLNNLLVAATSDRAAQQIEEITARTASETLKAKGQQMAAQLRGRAADMTMAAVQNQIQFDQRERFQKQEMGFKYSSLAETKRSNLSQEQLKREDMYLDYQKALAAANAKGGEEAMKARLKMMEDNETRGVGNIAKGGEPLLNKQGIEMLKQADAKMAEAKALREIDAKAVDAGTPLDMKGTTKAQMAETRAKALEEQASQLRGEAYITGQFRARSPVEATELSKKYGAAQSVITLIDDIKKMYDDNGRSYFSTDEGRAALQTKFNSLAPLLKDAWQLGAWDKGSATLVAKIIGTDPSSGWEPGNVASLMGAKIGKEPEAFKKQLDEVANGLETDVYNQLRAAKWDAPKEELFGRKKEMQKTPEQQATVKLNQGPTPLEAAEGTRSTGSGVVDKAASFAADRLRFVSRDDKADAIENSGSQDYIGLSKPQGEAFGALVNAYKTGGAGGQKAGEQLVQTALQASPTKSIAVMHLLRDTAPDLYEKARGQIKPDSDVGKQLDYEDTNRVGVEMTPAPMLGQAAIIGDKASFEELSRRAGTGDKQAQSILKGVIDSRDRQRDPLGISRGGR